MKDIEKMDKRIKEIVAESQKLVDEFNAINEQIKNANNRKAEIATVINTNSGRIQEINKWKEAIEVKVDNKVDKSK